MRRLMLLLIAVLAVHLMGAVMGKKGPVPPGAAGTGLALDANGDLVWTAVSPSETIVHMWVSHAIPNDSTGKCLPVRYNEAYNTCPGPTSQHVFVTPDTWVVNRAFCIGSSSFLYGNQTFQFHDWNAAGTVSTLLGQITVGTAGGTFGVTTTAQLDATATNSSGGLARWTVKHSAGSGSGFGPIAIVCGMSFALP